jgi:hypothetical protein
METKNIQHSRYAIFIPKNIPKIINILTVIKTLKRIRLTKKKTWNEESNAQKDKIGRDNAKISRNHALEAKRRREIEWGMLRDAAARVFLKPVGSPSGRLINPSRRALPHKHATSRTCPDF